MKEFPLKDAKAMLPALVDRRMHIFLDGRGEGRTLRLSVHAGAL